MPKKHLENINFTRKNFIGKIYRSDPKYLFEGEIYINNGFYKKIKKRAKNKEDFKKQVLKDYPNLFKKK